MEKVSLKIASPESVVHESEVESVTCPTAMGEVTVLPNHIPLVATIVPGEIRVTEGNETRYMAVAGGFLEVRPNSEVIVLADAVEHVEEIDLKRAEEAREKARKLMKEEVLDAEKFAQVQASLERSLSRIRIAKKRKYKDVGKQ